jgi:hypothetical protein
VKEANPRYAVISLCKENRIFIRKAKQLIDDLKSVCANYGLGNDGNEFKIITQVFLYKFLNDKFAYEAKRIDPSLAALGGQQSIPVPSGAGPSGSDSDPARPPSTVAPLTDLSGAMVDKKGSRTPATSWEDALRAYSAGDYDMLLAQLGGSTAQLRHR